MPNICEDLKLKEMFINMSTNRDLRNILKYYEEKGYDKEGLVADFEEIMEYISTEEIATRLEQDLYIDFDGIKISNDILDESLVANSECKNVQLEIIAQRSNLSFIAIQLMLDNNVAYPETIDIAIKNSTDPNIGDLDSERLCLLNKDSVLKLVEASNGDEEFIYLLSLKPELTSQEIDIILNAMKNNKVEMDSLFGESLLSQKNLTKEQEKEIAFFERVPSSVVFDICLSRGLYSQSDIEFLYKQNKDDIEFINIILNNKDIPKTIISDIFVNGTDEAKTVLDNKTRFDLEFQKTVEDLSRNDLSVLETKRIVDLVEKDARFLSFAVHSPNSNILNKALSAIEEFYKYTGNESIYEKRCELLNILANNKNISNLTLNDIILYNSDAFSSEELEDLSSTLNSRLTPEEIEILEAQSSKIQEDLDEYLLDMKIKDNRTYDGDYDYPGDSDDYR